MNDWPDVYRGFDARYDLPVASESVDLVATSTPYLWRSKYSDASNEFGAGSLGRFIADQENLAMVMWDVVRPGGWYVLNLADTRANTGGSGGDITAAGKRVYRQGEHGIVGQQWIGVPHRVALAIQAHTGWQWTGEVVWSKGRPVRTDNAAHFFARNRRPGLAHEYLFWFWKPGGPQTWNTEPLLSTPYDRDAPALDRVLARYKAKLGRWHDKAESDAARRVHANAQKPSIGSVWTIPPVTIRPPWATPKDDVKAWPYEIPHRLIATLTNPGDLVVDPCAGYGTTGVAARDLGRREAMFDLYWGRAEWPGNEAAAG